MEDNMGSTTADSVSDRPFECLAREQLLSNITKLNQKGPLELTVIATIQAAEKFYDGTVSEENPHTEIMKAYMEKMFASHAGKSRGVILRNAISFVQDEIVREVSKWNSKQMRNSSTPDEIDAKWFHNPLETNIKGPRPDSKVWLEILLGEDRVEELLGGSCKLNCGGTFKRFTEKLILDAMINEASHLSTPTLLANILAYMRRKAQQVTPVDMLRFSILYGFDGVMRDVIRGNYGETEGLTIYSLVKLSDEPVPRSRLPPSLTLFRDNQKLILIPAFHFGVILGYSNIVVTAYEELGAAFSLQFPVQGIDEHEEAQYDHQVLPSIVFLWIFMKNDQEMIRCLVNQCNFQFRWIGHEFFKTKIFERLFESNEYEAFPRWLGENDEHHYMTSSRRRGGHLSTIYKNQMEMLDTLIELGLPFSLLFPTEPKVEEEERLQEENRLKTSRQYRDYISSLSGKERSARDRAGTACCAYNMAQEKESKKMYIGEFYRSLKSKWDVQKSVQVDKLPQYEALDSRWTNDQDSDEDDLFDDESDFASEFDTDEEMDDFPF